MLRNCGAVWLFLCALGDSLRETQTPAVRNLPYSPTRGCSTYVHTYIHACIHTYIHTRIHDIHACMHACLLSQWPVRSFLFLRYLLKLYCSTQSCSRYLRFLAQWSFPTEHDLEEVCLLLLSQLENSSVNTIAGINNFATTQRVSALGYGLSKPQPNPTLNSNFRAVGDL